MQQCLSSSGHIPNADGVLKSEVSSEKSSCYKLTLSVKCVSGTWFVHQMHVIHRNLCSRWDLAFTGELRTPRLALWGMDSWGTRRGEPGSPSLGKETVPGSIRGDLLWGIQPARCKSQHGYRCSAQSGPEVLRAPEAGCATSSFNKESHSVLMTPAIITDYEDLLRWERMGCDMKTPMSLVLFCFLQIANLMSWRLCRAQK